MGTAKQNDEYGNRRILKAEIERDYDELGNVVYAHVTIVVHDGVLVRGIRNGETPEGVLAHYLSTGWTDNLCDAAYS